jgi:hypothetical protein
MAHRTVQLIIGRILADEEFRDEFLAHPAATLAGLRDRGIDLTDAEAAALVDTDRGLWTLGAKRLDARLQRCRLTGASK